MSTYDPDSKLSMGSLWGLEINGMKIVTSLGDNITRLQAVAKITLHEWDLKDWTGRQLSVTRCVEILMKRWGGRKGFQALTWRSLLNVLREMDLGELSLQMEDYLSGTFYIIYVYIYT